jgi:excisionase family DNA binding protein
MFSQTSNAPFLIGVGGWFGVLPHDGQMARAIVSDGVLSMEEIPNMTRESHVLLLTASEAAKALAVSPRTLWSLTKSGVIPCVRIGRAVRYDPADLRSWIASKKTTPA